MKERPKETKTKNKPRKAIITQGKKRRIRQPGR